VRFPLRRCSDHNGMGHTPHEAAVGYGCRVPLQDLTPRTIALCKPHRTQDSFPEITLRSFHGAHLGVELQG
jgi:hypothetical protein